MCIIFLIEFHGTMQNNKEVELIISRNQFSVVQRDYIEPGCVDLMFNPFGV